MMTQRLGIGLSLMNLPMLESKPVNDGSGGFVRSNIFASVFAKKAGLRGKAGPPVHDDLVERNFNATRANELWLTDITEHQTSEGKLYLCAIKDVHSNRIVGYSIDSRMKASLAVAAVHNAIMLRSPAGTVVHSDSSHHGHSPTK